ncbi:MAG: L-seryl-tRNA(Sec) selenium transferase, partial [Acidobacteria bacterium]|nr:L-seryl-tRNA(Sec) selenium transferase [Acidobacteriota bacterium]
MTAASDRASLFRQIPSLDEFLLRPAMTALAQRSSRPLLVETARRVLDEVREEISRATDGAAPTLAQLEGRVTVELDRSLTLSLRPVINATGVILHTNLGRAPLSVEAIEHLRSSVTRYSNLEYDIASGARGKRDVHTARLLAKLSGAESAIVVNNNAAAVFLVLHALAKGAEVIVSRGELIEIGDGFRIPDIMAESGAVLREVGTTNKTSIADYERAIGDRTRLLLRVHPSNFRIEGFTARPSLEELSALGRRFSLPVFEDLGSGCLVDLSAYGFNEPVVRTSIEAGASLVCFSGDKLLGGPQAGIIAGSRDLVDRIRKNPLFRALRVDKMTVAALEAILNAYLRGAHDEIPTLRMIRISAEEVGRRAESFLSKIQDALTKSSSKAEILDGSSVIGGGSTPGENLPTRLIAITSPHHSAAQLEERLRLGT